MTQEQFIEVLNKEGYSYEIEGDKIVVTGNRHLFLGKLKTLPPGVEFRNRRNVSLDTLKTLPPGTKFNNGGRVGLHSLETLPPGVEFNNGGSVYLRSLIGGGFEHWSGNIDGIYNKMLLNLMIKQGVFI